MFRAANTVDEAMRNTPAATATPPGLIHLVFRAIARLSPVVVHEEMYPVREFGQNFAASPVAWARGSKTATAIAAKSGISNLKSQILFAFGSSPAPRCTFVITFVQFARITRSMLFDNRIGT
jgi:hypothetical protein